MRCRVCGYEVGPEATHCPMCGRVAAKAASDGEISWNTKDFPKPREMEDIKMAWPDLNTRGHSDDAPGKASEKPAEKAEPVAVMSEDASEGYVSIPEKKEPEKKEPEKKAPEKKEEAAPAEPYWFTQKFTATGIMKTGPAWPSAQGNSIPSYPSKATIESMTLEDILQDYKDDDAEPEIRRNTGERFPMLDTLAQKNAEFQKLLDMEYDRLHAMHGDEALKELEDARFVPDQSVKAKDISTFEKMLMENTSAVGEETPAQKFFSKPTEAEKAAADKDLEAFIAPSGDPSKYDIDQIENTIKELQEEEKRAEKRRTERQKRLETMALAREAYLRSLDEANSRKSKKAEPKAAAAVADASPVDIWETSEPTKEIPVGSILKALAAGGALAAVEKSVEDAVKAPAEVAKKAAEEADEAAEKAAEVAENVAEKAEDAANKAAEAAEPVRAAAAMAVQPIASIRQDLEPTRVFRRSLTEEAEERARAYENAEEEAFKAAIAVDTRETRRVERISSGAEDLARRYEVTKQEEEKEAESIEKTEEKLAAVFKAAEDKAADTAGEAENKAAEVFGTAEDAVKDAEDKAVEDFKDIEEKAAEIFGEADAELYKGTEERAADAVNTEEISSRVAAAVAAAVAEKEAGEAESRLAEAAAKIEQQLARGLDGSDSQAVDLGEEDKKDAAQAADGQQADQAEEQKEAAGQTAEDLAGKYEDADDQQAAAGQQADQAEEKKDDDLSAAFAGKDPAEPTHEFDPQEVQNAQDTKEEKKEEEDDDDDDEPGERKSKHVFLKIIAVILIICAIFEAAVWGLK